MLDRLEQPARREALERQGQPETLELQDLQVKWVRPVALAQQAQRVQQTPD